MTAHPMLDTRAALLRLGTTALAFCVLYTGCNLLTQARGRLAGGAMASGAFGWEHATPLLAWTIVPYLSIVGFFVLSFLVGRERRALDRHVSALGIDRGLSALCWLVVPLRFAFERPLIADWTAPFFALLSAIDLPYNRAPSLHISVLVILTARFLPLVAGWPRRALLGWFALVGVSVLTTWQHHLIDIPAGLAVGAVSLWVAAQWTIVRPWRSLPTSTVSVPIASIRRGGACSTASGR